MTIASEITRINNNIASAYTAVNNKGGTLPATQNSANLATAIGSIPTGSTPTLITKTITQNGTYNANSDNADGYSSVTVNVSGYTELPSYQVVNGVANKRGGVIPNNIFDDITSIGQNGLKSVFYQKGDITGNVYFTNLLSVGKTGMYETFYECSQLDGVVSFPKLETIDVSGMAYSFNSTHITSLDLSKLVSVANMGLQRAFYQCSYLTSIDISNLETIGTSGLYYAFYSCQRLAGSVNFTKLNSIDSSGLNYAFGTCYNLSSIYFNSLTTSSFGSYVNQFNYMFNSNTASTSGSCTVHFPSNLQSKIASLTGYPSFGGNSSRIVLAFDLPSTS